MYIQLYQAKKHLNIDPDFTDDDEYIMDLVHTAEKAVELSCDVKLSSMEDGDGHIPSPLSHAMLMLVANWYANRESVSTVNLAKIPHAFEFLVGLYKDYFPPLREQCKQED